MEVRDKVALVTGGASGIGLATVERLSEEGAKVFVVDLDEQGAQSAAGSFGGLGHAADVGDPDQVDEAFERCERELGAVDIAFLNAGIAIGVADLTQLDGSTYRRIMRVNVDGVVYGLRAAIRSMQPRGQGAIVATASLAGIVPFPPDPIYDASKHAVVGLIRSVAPTLEPLGITANCVNPGMTDTNILSDDAKAMFAEMDFPLMPARQIADAVLEAVTSGATGQVLRVPAGSGGRAVRVPQRAGPAHRRGARTRATGPARRRVVEHELVTADFEPAAEAKADARPAEGWIAPDAPPDIGLAGLRAHLERLLTRHDLDALTVVVDDPDLGRQAFRVGAGAIPAGLTASGPGVLSEPGVPTEALDADLLVALCRGEPARRRVARRRRHDRRAGAPPAARCLCGRGRARRRPPPRARPRRRRRTR